MLLFVECITGFTTKGKQAKRVSNSLLTRLNCHIALGFGLARWGNCLRVLLLGSCLRDMQPETTQES